MTELYNVYPVNDIHIERAEGSTLWDRDGRQYLDFYGGHAVISIGHRHAHWTGRLKQQMELLPFYSNSVKLDIQEELAHKLGSVAGKEDYDLFLCNSGAEANENALKVASFASGRKKVVCFSGAFHGRTSLAVAATDNAKITAPVNETDNIIRLPFNDTEALETCFKKQGNQIACVITEGIQGVGGIVEAGKDFLQAVRRLCNAYGAYYIADSVQCGCGRTGIYFSHDYAGVEADMYTMAKGVGNGFPAAGVLIKKEITPWYGMLGTTFGGNPLACAAMLAVHEVMESENLMAAAEEKGARLAAALRKMDGLQNVRGRGLMIGFDVEGSLAGLRKDLLQKHSIFTGEAKPNTIRLLPAYTISDEECVQLLDAIQLCINDSKT